MTINSVLPPVNNILYPAATKPANSTTSDSAFLSVPQDSNPDLSPAARMLNLLQELQQQDPSKFKQVTAQMADRLRTAAKEAGNATVAGNLNKLADQFQQASGTGQLPGVQALQQAGISGHHHGAHRHHGGEWSEPNSLTGLLDPVINSSSAGASSTGSNR